jgi:hypothetical protein
MAGTSFDGRSSSMDSIPTQLLDRVLRVDIPSMPEASGVHRAAPGAYLLVNFAAKTTTVVMPGSQQYWETRFNSAPVRRAQSTTVISDIDVSGAAVGSGGIVNGHVTTRYRITSRYTEIDTTGRGARKKVQLVEDVWVPDALNDVPDVPDPMQAYLRVFARSGAVGELVEKQAEARRKLFKGLPVRTTWLVTQTFGSGAQASRALTIDILDLKRTDLDVAAFRVPDDYRRFDLTAALKNAAELLRKAAKEQQ